MRKATLFLLGLAGMLCVGSGQARMAGSELRGAQRTGPQAEEALRDTLARLGPLMGHRWLRETGHRDYLLRHSWEPRTDEGLRCVGRWSFGPSLKVSLRITPDDTIVCLTRGSGASLIRFDSRDGVTLDLLGDVNFAGRPRRAVIADTLVIAGIQFGASGLEVHGVSDPALPGLLSRVSLPIVNDIAVKDTLVFAACEDDTLRVFSIADPRRPVLVGALRDSCDLYMTLAGDYCYLVHVSGVNIVDVSDPANPRRVGRIGGGEPLAVHVRDTLAYVMMYGYGLRVFDIGDPAAPRPLGSLEGPNVLDVSMAETCDTLLYTPMLDVISVANPAQPGLLGRADVPADMRYGIAVPPGSGHALVANYFDGLVVVDVSQPAAPKVDTMAFAATSTEDIWVDGDRAYLGSTSAGFSILDVSDPTRPRRLGQLNGPGRLGNCLAVTARDSFAFIGWGDSVQLWTVRVQDPARPEVVGRVRYRNRPRAIALRDTFVYLAENRYFEVVNVARPREPVLVGSCELPDNAAGMWLQDTLAYVAYWPVSIINVADPRSPAVIGQIWRGCSNVVLDDTVAFLSSGVLIWYSVADPASPYPIDSMDFGYAVRGLAIADTVVYAGTNDGRLHAVSVADLHRPRLLASATLPYVSKRITYAAPYLYVACWDAGVSIYETVSTGVAEERSPVKASAVLQVHPNPVRGKASVSVESGNMKLLALRDVAGREVIRFTSGPQDRSGIVDLSGLRSGVYILEVEVGGQRRTAKLVRQ